MKHRKEDLISMLSENEVFKLSDKPKQWYEYTFMHGKSPDSTCELPYPDSIVFAQIDKSMFSEIVSLINQSSKRNVVNIIIRLLKLGLVRLNNNHGTYELIACTDNCLDIQARIRGYIFRHDFKAIGKYSFIKQYLLKF